MSTRTPSAKDVHILDFCRMVAPASKPVLVPINPEPLSIPLECFHNVRQKVEAEGGRLVTGWAIWEWPRVYIEAEHHAVYEAPNGHLIDVTPSPIPGFTSRVFLADPTASYDFDNEGVRRDNHRRALRKDPLIEAFFSGARDYSAAMNALPGVGEIKVTPAVARQIEALGQRQVRLTLELAMKYSSRNDPCFCGGGRKFKQCHGAK
jgi:hypothetical protein